MSNAVGVNRPPRYREWKPAALLESPPVFVWPPRPARFLTWLFGFPGYLWPWNALYAAIAIATWFLATPDLSRMKMFEVGWIAAILGRNAVLLFVVVSIWHLRLYVQRAQDLEYKYSGRWLAKKNAAFLFNDQLLDNMFWNLVSAVPIWTAYEVVTLWGQANGYLPSLSWQEHPVYFVLLMVLIPLYRDVHFYLIHRLIHWPPLYRAVHQLHHNNVNPGPWSGLAMHPVEHLLYFSCVLLHWIVPSHPIHALFNLQHAALSPAQGHSGFHRIVLGGGAEIGSDNYMHYLHHKYFEVNYGGDGTVPIDKWFGTFNDGSEAANEAMNRRLLKRRAS